MHVHAGFNLSDACVCMHAKKEGPRPVKNNSCLGLKTVVYWMAN